MTKQTFMKPIHQVLWSPPHRGRAGPGHTQVVACGRRHRGGVGVMGPCALAYLAVWSHWQDGRNHNAHGRHCRWHLGAVVLEIPRRLLMWGEANAALCPRL